VEYKFRADPILAATPPREWILALHALYEVDGAFFSTTFFNATVDIAEAPRLVDLDLVWLAGTLVMIAAGVGARLAARGAGARAVSLAGRLGPDEGCGGG
jgi:hypothetical protein